ncbi:MAG: divergent polysaccharide deacetylase family protein [Alphaproteobacteria bacterium]|nr:divergent polysaccharide deacetylase family protein [Alphaproteobacteria bacterium]
MREKLAPLAHKVEDQFHHVVEEVEGQFHHVVEEVEGRFHHGTDDADDSIQLPPAFEHVAEHVPEKRRTAVFAGLGVLVLGFLIGVGIWLMRGPGADEAPQADSTTPSLSLPMPPRAGPGGDSLLNPSPPPPPGQDLAGKQAQEGEGASPSLAEPQTATPLPPPAAGEVGTQNPLGPMQPGGEAPLAQPAGTDSTAKPPMPSFEAPSLRDAAGSKLTSLSPVTGEPRLPANTGQLSVPTYANLPAIPPPAQPPVPLPEAPQPALVKKTDAGNIPTVGSDGREAWKAYARPFDLGDKRPRIAVVVLDLGVLKEGGEAAIARMPPEITLAFSPYAPKIDDWMKRARSAGHEVLLGLPLDSRNFPMRDPGPMGLISALSTAENLRRLETLLTHGQGYTGLVAVDGQRFLTVSSQVDSLFRALKQSGLLFIDNGLAGDQTAARLAEALDLPYAKANIMIDERHFRTALDIRLRKAEDDAQAKGRALVLIPPRPLAMDRVAAWVKDLQARGIVLAPVSAVVTSKQP